MFRQPLLLMLATIVQHLLLCLELLNELGALCPDTSKNSQFHIVTNLRERERERLHLSSPEADSGAARTSPGRSQKMKQCHHNKEGQAYESHYEPMSPPMSL